MVNIKNIIENTGTKSGKAFDLSIQVLIIFSLISFSIETLPSLSDNTKILLERFEIFTIIIFTIEYIARLLVATKKLAFIFSIFGIIDLLAILPFYFSIGIDLRSIRAFRLLRILRILKLGRYNIAIKRFYRALIIAKEELLLFIFAALIVLYLA